MELYSTSHSLAVLQAKLEEYIANGARLGWLIDPRERSVYIYRPGKLVEHDPNPQNVSGGDELAGFTLNSAELW